MSETLREMFAVAWHTIAIYFYLVLMFRIIGRRQLGQLNVIDLVIIVIMGSAVETAMVAGNTSLQAGLVSASALLVANRLIAALLSRSRKWRRLVSGDPVLLVREGHFIEENLRRTGLTHEAVLEGMREREEFDLPRIRFAVLETNGTITVIPKDAEVHRVQYRDGKTAPPDSTPAPG